MGQISFLMPNTALQQKVVKTLATAQVLNGIGVAGTVAAGSLLVSSITNSETLAGLAQTFSVLGAAAMALPLARLTARGGRRLSLSQTKPNIKLGICGEHAGDPMSIDFCHRTGLNYVSCSPPRVPIARLAAAQARLRNK